MPYKGAVEAPGAVLRSEVAPPCSPRRCLGGFTVATYRRSFGVATLPPFLGKSLGMQTLQHRLRIRIGLLQLNAPIFQFLQRNRYAGHRATYKGSRPHNAEIAVEIFNFCLPGHGRAMIEAIEQINPPFRLAITSWEPLLLR
jgi:hypothetical protein